MICDPLVPGCSIGEPIIITIDVLAGLSGVMAIDGLPTHSSTVTVSSPRGTHWVLR
jgi:hypothetical protein